MFSLPTDLRYVTLSAIAFAPGLLSYKYMQILLADLYYMVALFTQPPFSNSQLLLE